MCIIYCFCLLFKHVKGHDFDLSIDVVVVFYLCNDIMSYFKGNTKLL